MSTTTGGIAGACEPRLTLHREGDRIIGIQIRCSCGQQIDLSCAYEEAPPGLTAPAPSP